MLLKANSIADKIENTGKTADPLVISPRPNLDDLRGSGSGAVDLRLGTWIASLRRARMAVLATDESEESRVLKHRFVPLGAEYYLHPGTFVLGATLEWLRLPANLGGYVLGRSSWGRRGLVIATAVGVHPGFIGCLTLEITNLGEIPIQLRPGMRICQLFLHNTDSAEPEKDSSTFVGQRRPALGSVGADAVAQRLFKRA